MSLALEPSIQASTQFSTRTALSPKIASCTCQACMRTIGMARSVEKTLPHASSFVKGRTNTQEHEGTKAKKRKRAAAEQDSNHARQGGGENNSAVTSTDILKTSLLKFFEKKENIDKFLPIINKTSPISLRLLDYFCVNYSRSTQVVYMIADKYFDVYSSYKNQLKTFSKKRFDPFRRNTRMTYRYENERFETTVGQLCFFKWCLTNNVLDYVEKNIVAISEDMKKIYGKPVEDVPGHTSERRKRSSRKKSSITLAATRVPTPPGTDTIVVSFE